MRGVGAIPALGEALSEPGVAAMAALTHLGATPVVLAGAAAVYWFHDRRAGGFALGAILGGLALVTGLKAAFALPRPPAGVRVVAAEGYGFPSGHAVAATVAWGALALALDAGTRRARAGVAAAVVAVVSLSRVALGVHYAVDVVAGVAVGAAYLTLLARASEGDPGRALGIAVAVGLGAFAVSTTAEAAALLGGAAGGLATWHRFEIPDRPWSREGVLPAAAAGLLGGVAVAGVHYGAVGPVLGLVAGAVAVGAAVALPAIVEGAG